MHEFTVQQPDAIEHFGDTEPSANEMRDYLKDKSDAELCAEALTAWANCTFVKPPMSFGFYMAEVGMRLGISPTGDNLMKYSAEKILNKNK